MKRRLLAAFAAALFFLQPSLCLAANVVGKDGNGAVKNWKANGDGSSGTPYIQHTIPTDGTNTAVFETAGADAGSNTASRLAVTSWLQGFNGTTWDRVRVGLMAPTASVTGYLNVLPFARYNATPPTLTDGQAIVLQVNAAGALKVDSSGATQSISGSVAATQSGTWNVGLSAGSNTIGKVDQGAGGASAWKVDGSSFTQPVSGTFWQATQPVSLASAVTVQQSTAANLKVDLSGTAANTTAIKVDGSSFTQPVSGTFWQATQPVSGTVTANLSASTNAGATAKTLDYDSGAGTDTVTGFGVLLPKSGGAVAGGTSSDPIRIDPTGTTTQPVSVSSLPLPSGAATSAKQPALGTAGSASSDVLTIQGIASMTAVKTDGSGVTQPVSGTVTANIGTSGSLALDATLTGGTAKAIARGGAKGSTSAADVTSTASGSNHQPLDVVIYDTSGNAITSFGGSGGTSSSFGSAFPSTGTAIGASDGTNMQALKVDGSNNLLVKINAGGATQPVSGTVTANQGGAPWSDNITQVGGSSLALGQTTMSASLPVALASNQSDLPSKTAQATATTGAFTNATQTTSVSNTSVSGYPTVTVSINGTYGTATGVFEASDDAGTTWYGVDATRTDSNTIETGYTSLTNTSRMWVVPINGANQFRVRSTAVASGTANIRITPTGAITADATVVSIGSALPTGSNVIGALSANQSVNVAQLAGTTTDTNSGNKSAGTLRVVLATDQPQLTNKLLVTPDANSAINVAQIGGNSVNTGTGNAGTGTARVVLASDQPVVATGGNVAHDGVDSGNPVKQGFKAINAEVTAVANADRVDGVADLTGKQIVLPYANPENFIAGKTSDITGTSDTAVIAAQGSGVRIYVTQITVTNSHASTGTWVNIKDGSTTIYTGYAAAAGGGFTITFPVPLRLTANTALNAANETTSSNTRVSASGYKGS